MEQSEKKSFRRFLAIYILLTATLLTAVSIIYYKSSSEKIELQYKTLMQELSVLQIKRLKWLHNHFPKYNKYPRDERFNSAIYDLEYQEIFSTLKSNEIKFNTNFYFTKNYAIYVATLSDYYLGAKYLFIEVPKNRELLLAVIRNIILYGSLSFLVLLLLGYYLAKLFIKPMQDSIELLDNFIKDTTHEINTPISIINTNIEMIQESPLCEKEVKKIKRIQIASKTLETIYKDLKLTILTTDDKESIEKYNIKVILEERLEYFSLHLESKKIEVSCNLDNVELLAEKALLERMIDNILSNAIKYNRVGGKIDIELNHEFLKIGDTGVGISKDEIELVFERYRRFNSSEGGFGIGLNIVYSIAKKYNYTVEIESEKSIGTKVWVRW